MTWALLALLPPSETKRASSADGGSAAFPGRCGADAGSSVSGGASSPPLAEVVGHPLQAAARAEAIAELARLAADPAAHAAALKLSAAQAERELARNASLETQARMPAIERYTGVLYDALDAASLDPSARRWLGAHVLIHSAPFGPVGALDEIPVYRLAAGTSLPGIPPLRRHWAAATSAALADADFVLDLRSAAYVALGPVPATTASAYVRVVTDAGRALNHFNKRAKGELVRALASTRPRVGSRADLLAWAADHGIALRDSSDAGVLELVAG